MCQRPSDSKRPNIHRPFMAGKINLPRQRDSRLTRFSLPALLNAQPIYLGSENLVKKLCGSASSARPVECTCFLYSTGVRDSGKETNCVISPHLFPLFFPEL